MDNYESNSHKSKAERKETLPEKRIEKVVSGVVKSKKKTGLQKISNVFVSEDMETVKNYIVEDIIVPAVKDMILDAVMACLGVDKKFGRSSAASKEAYRGYYNKDRRRDLGRPRTKVGYDYDDIILDNRGEAEEVLLKMDELIDTYGLVSVADFYELVGVDGSYTDNKYGWNDIQTASVIRMRDGYMIKLPKALPIN